jgi:hypothetical protein
MSRFRGTAGGVLLSDLDDELGGATDGSFGAFASVSPCSATSAGGAVSAVST